MPQISVIVPIYKIPEAYLRRAIESAIHQTIQDIEIILVDDGSPDQSGAICDEYACADKRIRVAHKENGGVSRARNTGIELARGNWICFLDPDDWMPEDALEKLLDGAHNTGADIVIGGFQFYHEEKEGKAVGFSQSMRVIENDCVRDYAKFIVCPNYTNVKQHNINWGTALQNSVPWGKLYTRTLWQDMSLLFEPDLHPSEDVLFNFVAATRAKRITQLNQCVYFYRLNGQSVTMTYKNTWIQNQMKYLEKLEKYLYDFDSAEASLILDAAVWGTTGALLQRYYFHPSNPKTRNAVYEELQNLCENTYLKNALCDVNNPFYNKKQKMMRLFFKWHIWAGLELLAFMKKLKIKIAR